MPSKDEPYDKEMEERTTRDVRARLVQLEGLMSMPEGQSESLYGLVQRVKELERRAAGHESRLDGQAKTDAALETHLDKLDREVRELDINAVRREDAEEVATQVRDEAEEIWHRLRECEDALAAVSSPGQSARLTRVEDQASGALQRLAELEKQVAKLDDAVWPARMEGRPRDFSIIYRLDRLEEWRSSWTSPNAKLDESLLVARLGAIDEQLGDLKAMLRDGDTLDDIRTAIQTNAASIKSLARHDEIARQVGARLTVLETARDAHNERLNDADELLAELSKRLDSRGETKTIPQPFQPLERVHLVELQMVMSLVKPQGWTVKDFIGFVEVRSCHPAAAHVRPVERSQYGRTVAVLEGACLEDSRMVTDLTTRLFALIGERAAAACRVFERVTDDRVSVELHEVRWYGEERCQG